MKKKQTCQQNKIKTVMSEFKNKKLKTSSGKKVKNPKQAIAIAINISKKACSKK